MTPPMRLAFLPRLQGCWPAAVIAALLWMAVPLANGQTPAADFRYVTNNGAITITGYLGGAVVVTVPATIDDMPVTRVGEFTFSGKAALKSVTLSNGITNVSQFAFNMCTGLTNIELPASLVTIESDAFRSCFSLQSVSLPANATNIGRFAFCACLGLQQVILPAGLKQLPEAVFANCTSLAGLSLPAGITHIGREAFSGCIALTNVVLPTGLRVVDIGAFRDCTSLAQMTMPDSVTNELGLTFSGCTNLVSVQLSAGVKVMLRQVFQGCSALRTVDLPEGLTSIREASFAECFSLTHLTIPAGVQDLRPWVFSDCPQLQAVYFLGSPPGPNQNVFDGSTNATLYCLPEATGWGVLFNGRPVVRWRPVIQPDPAAPRFGLPNATWPPAPGGTSRFTFQVTGPSTLSVVVEAAASPVAPSGNWVAIRTNRIALGVAKFVELSPPQVAGRYYRVRWP